jgi:RHS repeat-associated protein
MSTDSGTTTHEFTGDERDAETGLDHTDFRQYSSAQARWLTPDAAGLAAVDPTNPQSVVADLSDQHERKFQLLPNRYHEFGRHADTSD